MIARLYADENFPLPVVEALRGFGHDVLTTQDAGMANEGIPDQEVLAPPSRPPLSSNTNYLELRRPSTNLANEEKDGGEPICTGPPPEARPNRPGP
jgi:hypothetical protein